jgi:hypothetical protein
MFLPGRGGLLFSGTLAAVTADVWCIVLQGWWSFFIAAGCYFLLVLLMPWWCRDSVLGFWLFGY